MKIFYLGPEGSFSQSAAMLLRDRLPPAVEVQLQAHPTVDAVAQAVRTAAGQLAIVPYYNFLEGLVQEHLDLLFENDLSIVGLIRLSIELAAGAAADGNVTEVVYSHPKALAQVSEYLRAQLPHARIEAVNSTAEAARRVAEQGSGVAIAGEAALARHGLRILARDVGNRRHGRGNFTDFFVVAANAEFDLPQPDARHTLLAITPRMDRPGLLAEILGQFAFYGLDIAKIHSRPALQAQDASAEPQMFYLEVKCERGREALRRCGAAIEYWMGDAPAAAGSSFKVLGDFPAASS